MASAYHHVGFQVSDIDRAAAFYIDTFEGHWLTRPVLMDDEIAATVMDGPPGTRFRHCKIGFDPGAVELFEFVGPDVPAWSVGRTWLRLPHFSIVVDDVPATLQRVEEAGGRRLWPEIQAWGKASTIYVSDPDGNVFELIDATLEEVVETTLGLFPQARP